MESVEGMRVVVMGLGRFGGGVGVTRWLAESGADVLVTDSHGPDVLGESVGQIQDLVHSGAVELRLGEHRVSDFTGADLVVVNPAVPRPWDDRFVRSARAGGVELTTEIGLATRLIGRDRVLGVTGSSGKSTVCSMIEHTLHAAGVPCTLGGNIGGSLLSQVNRIGADEIVVLELSSAMLYWLGMDGWSPRVAVVTNLEANHLDWHGDFAHYNTSKKKILESQIAGDAAVLGSRVADWAVVPGVDQFVIDSDEGVAECAVPGRHNAWNARVACVAAGIAAERIGGRVVASSELEHGVRSFAGLAHRLRLVHEADGVAFFDDSKSTVPGATVLAVEALKTSRPDGRIHLICGGFDKEIDLSEIAGLGDRVARMWCIGDTGPWIAEASGERGVDCGTLDVAVRRAMQEAGAGDVVLLSPGCASWDQFANFEARGRAFLSFARRGASPAHEGSV